MEMMAVRWISVHTCSFPFGFMILCELLVVLLISVLKRLVLI